MLRSNGSVGTPFPRSSFGQGVVFVGFAGALALPHLVPRNGRAGRDRNNLTHVPRCPDEQTQPRLSATVTRLPVRAETLRCSGHLLPPQVPLQVLAPTILRGTLPLMRHTVRE